MASRHDAVLQQDGTLTITGKCPISGKEWRLEGLEVDAYNRWRSGEYAQVAFPRLTADQRELLISGVTPEAWEQIFSEEE